jgi:hypothetical protein
VLSIEEEAIVVAFRKHTLLPLDDCLYSLQATIPQAVLPGAYRSAQGSRIVQLRQHPFQNMLGRAGLRKRGSTYPIVS